jgi:hypothetical protein
VSSRDCPASWSERVEAVPRAVTIVPERRSYNKWVAGQTLDGHAHRQTAVAARHWPVRTVLVTALGTSASLVCEVIGATITLLYGTDVSIAAILTGCLLMFVASLPIAVEAARKGLDIDLITRGAGFGYLGSTITTLIYASFTFLLFAIEASIMAVAVQDVAGIGIEFAYVLCALAVLPLAWSGMRTLARFQTWSQPVWIVLQLIPLVYVFWRGGEVITAWADFTGIYAPRAQVVSFGLALSVLLSLLPRIGEQVEYLRFMPPQSMIGKRRWWTAVVLGGPGWVLIGGTKLLLGSVLAAWAVSSGWRLTVRRARRRCLAMSLRRWPGPRAVACC